MPGYPLGPIGRALGGRWTAPPPEWASGVTTDSREARPDALFVALRGERFDGHDYVAQAASAGAVAAIVDRELASAPIPLLVTPNSLRAYQGLARWRRERFAAPVIGITGSVGKTSTREMMACALGALGPVLQSERNENNEVGVPRTLLRLRPEHAVVVVEMGMRGRGQIAELADIARPDAAVLTNIGLSHIELVGSRDGIASAKAELLEALPPGGVAVVPADDDYAHWLVGRVRCRVVTFGVAREADFRARDVRLGADGAPEFRIGGVTVRLRAPGAHHVANAVAAAAMACALGVSLAEAAARIEAFRPPDMRLAALEGERGVLVLDDTYNAAPDSVRAALETLAMVASSQGRRALVFLGAMRELGEHAAEAHRHAGELAARSGAALVVAVGSGAEPIAVAAAAAGAESLWLPDSETAAARALDLIQPGDIVLAKGSRAIAMERVVRALVAPGPGGAEERA
ncbi:MAG TPA: UDP-N-acetylmuramoyl-tripeptide--D-alanyl-D-alanine ligase [Chthonomonadales bacterium]|nr:UDP-N-acetylmuramoyl-tripeptide--D-alanyl-D-alanine ligase [Chthonomonadales bacterium]